MSRDSPNSGDAEEDSREPYRSSSVHRCKYCHTKTNLVAPTGFYGNYRVRCPVAVGAPTTSLQREKVEEKNHKHAELQQLIERRDDIDERLSMYARTDGSDTVLESLDDERDMIERRIAALRDWFDGRFDDIKDADDEEVFSEIDGSLARVDEEICSSDG